MYVVEASSEQLYSSEGVSWTSASKTGNSEQNSDSGSQSRS